MVTSKSSCSFASTRLPSSLSRKFRSVPSSADPMLPPVIASFETPWEATESPMDQYPSIRAATAVAPRMSPPTPAELSPSKNSRSPARDARLTMMSASRSERHWTNWSSGGIEETNPPMSPRRSIVAMSITMCRRVRYAATAWHASWIATACRSRLTYSLSSGRPCSFSCFARVTSAQLITSRPSRIAITSASFTMSWMLAPVAYGVMVASLSMSAGVRSCCTFAK